MPNVLLWKKCNNYFIQFSVAKKSLRRPKFSKSIAVLLNTNVLNIARKDF